MGETRRPRKSSLVQLEEPPLYATAGKSKVVVMTRDTVTARERTPKMSARRRVNYVVKGPIKGFSERSRKLCKRHLDNAVCYRAHMTLSFPQQVSDDVIVKKRLNAFVAWLLRQGTSLWWKREFHESGNPHLHLLLTKPILEHDAGNAWSKINGAPSRVWQGPITFFSGLSTYLLKPYGDPADIPPPGYQNLQRYWGTRGPDAKVQTLFSARGPIEEVTLILRLLRKIYRARRRVQGRRTARDKGFVGSTFYYCGGTSIAHALRRFVDFESLNVEVL